VQSRRNETNSAIDGLIKRTNLHACRRDTLSTCAYAEKNSQIVALDSLFHLTGRSGGNPDAAEFRVGTNNSQRLFIARYRYVYYCGCGELEAGFKQQSGLETWLD